MAIESTVLALRIVQGQEQRTSTIKKSCEKAYEGFRTAGTIYSTRRVAITRGFGRYFVYAEGPGMNEIWSVINIDRNIVHHLFDPFPADAYAWSFASLKTAEWLFKALTQTSKVSCWIVACSAINL